MFFFKQVPFLTPDENLACLKKINDLSSLYKYETLDYFATLGMAIYQHDNHLDQYAHDIKHLNFILWNHFANLYIKIKEFFEGFLKSKVMFPAYHVSLPGFHIFETGKKNSFPGGSPHYDLSFHSIPILTLRNTTSFPLHYSFTLPLQLPYFGSGINIWDLKFSEETQYLSSDEKASRCHSENAHFFPYRTGTLFIFNGYNYHQIAPIPKTIETDRRITLQGHLVQSDDNFLIYW